MKLTAQNVYNLVTDCLARETGEITQEQADEIKRTGIAPPGWKMVKAVHFHLMFNEKRLADHFDDIRSMLAELPEQFQNGKGGGWSFLNACMTQEGEHWGEHRDIDALICLGLGVGLIDFCMPKSMWPHLPGGMPYFSVKKEPNEKPFKIPV